MTPVRISRNQPREITAVMISKVLRGGVRIINSRKGI